MPEILAIGSSTGGPQALFEVFKRLPLDWNLPIVITQHMPATFTKILANHLESVSKRPCVEAQGGEVVESGHVYVAPGDHHLLLENKAARIVTRLPESPPENFCRPAVDPMMRSIVSVYGPRVLSLILTGMGKDGLSGCQAVVAAGGTVIAQDEETSIVWGMPGAVAVDGICSAVLPLQEIAAHITNFRTRTAA
jgi:two-component system chemotaxis response regulator CheB